MQGGFDADLPGHGGFDAAVGRGVLTYQPDPGAAVATLAGAVRPGGLLVFQKHDATLVSDGRADLPLHNQVRAVIWETVRRKGARDRMGFGLYAILAAAGLGVQTVRAEANLQTLAQTYPIGEHHPGHAAAYRAPGRGPAAELDVGTLDQRLAEERRRTGATTQVWELAFCAWARKPM